MVNRGGALKEVEKFNKHSNAFAKHINIIFCITLPESEEEKVTKFVKGT